MSDELDPVEQRLGDLFNQVSAPETMRRYETSGGGDLAGGGARWWSRALGALFGAGSERRLRPLAAALVLPLLVLAVGGGLQLRLHFSGTAGQGVNPPGRANAAMAFDAGHGVVVMFGGISGGSNLGDTWTWDGDSWTEQHPANSPSPRSNAVMGYDAGHNQVVLFGGTVSNPPGWGTHRSPETWTWDGSNWHLVATAHTPNSWGGGMAYDSERNQLVLVANRSGGVVVNGSSGVASGGGSAYGFAAPAAPHGHPVSLPTPSTPAPAPTPGCSAAPTGGTCSSVFQSISNGLSQGGSAPPSAAGTSPVQVPAVPVAPSEYPLHSEGVQTWTWTGSDWHLQSPTTNPMGWPNLFSPAFDAAAKHVVILATQPSQISCGYAVISGGPQQQGRPQASPQAVPQGGSSHVCTPATPTLTDPNGMSKLCASCPTVLPWAWDGRNWMPTKLGKGTAPASGLQVVSDTATGRLLGVDAGKTWSWTGSQWTTHPNPTALIGRRGFALAADTAHHNVVLFGGRQGSPQFGADTWTWDGSTWTHRAGALPPPLPSQPPVSPVSPPIAVVSAPPSCPSVLLSVSGIPGNQMTITVDLPHGTRDCPALPPGEAVTLVDNVDGKPLVVNGNPFQLGARTAVILVWTNYCGSTPPGGVRVTASAGGIVQAEPLNGSPACTDAAKPSTLTLAPAQPISTTIP